MVSTTYAILAFCFMHIQLIHSGDTDFTKETETTECPPGYTGETCGIQCRYPSFGQACQDICHCTETECDTVTGCKVCPIGYTGDKCEIPCHSPSYGDRCQMECSCAEEFCNFTYGCSTSSTLDSRNGHQTSTRTAIMMTSMEQTEIVLRPCGGCTKHRGNIFELKTKTVLFMSIVAFGVLAFIVLIVYAYTFFKTPTIESESLQHGTENNEDSVYEKI